MKIRLPIFLVMLALLALTGCHFSSESTTDKKTITEATAQPVAEKGEYNIGDTGPVSGLIFYINPNYETDGWRYLEAAPNDQSTGIRWGDYITTDAKAFTIGTGQSNTQAIVNTHVGVAEPTAAQLCKDLILGGYRDWFLPSEDELDQMYKNLQQNNVGSFSKDWYWSSSEVDAYSAWFQDFTDGYHTFKASKGIPRLVRAIRAF